MAIFFPSCICIPCNRPIQFQLGVLQYSGPSNSHSFPTARSQRLYRRHRIEMLAPTSFLQCYRCLCDRIPLLFRYVSSCSFNVFVVQLSVSYTVNYKRTIVLITIFPIQLYYLLECCFILCKHSCSQILFQFKGRMWKAISVLLEPNRVQGGAQVRMCFYVHSGLGGVHQRYDPG